METDVTQDEQSSRGRPRWVGVAVVAVLVAAVAAAVWFATRGGDRTVVGPDGREVEVIAEADGFTLTGSRVTDEVDPVTGEPGAARDEFAPGDTVRYWLSFDDSGVQPGRDTLFVVFADDAGDEIFRAPYRLPQPVGQQNAALGAGDTQEPGTYHVIVLLNDEEMHRETFEIR